jgi:alanine racemase
MYERCFAEISLSAIANNARLIRAKTSKNAKVMAVVKADGYGHGAVQVAKTALANGADNLAVATVDEGMKLRENNINAPILTFGFVPESEIPNAIARDIAMTVYSEVSAAKISRCAERMDTTARVHIKVDTGMTRLGFSPDSHACELIRRLPGLDIEGVYTHFAAADEKRLEFTYTQLKLFEEFVERLHIIGVNPRIRHCANSAGLLRDSVFHMDMVRAGIILYGLAPSRDVPIRQLGFKPAMSIKSCISMVKRVNPKIGVSYGRTFITNRETIIATIPVGYADGYRRVTNKGRVLINGEFAPILGRVCMDQFMVDVTNINGVTAEDEVVLIGKQGEHEIAADDIAELSGTINYEVVCGISKRVPRVYQSRV